MNRIAIFGEKVFLACDINALRILAKFSMNSSTRVFVMQDPTQSARIKDHVPSALFVKHDDRRLKQFSAADIA